MCGSSALRLVVIALAVWITGTVTVARAVSAPPQRESELNVTVSRSYAVAPADLRAMVRVARNADNRYLLVTLDSGEYLRHSTITLDGSRAAIQHPLAWRALPAGEYRLHVELVGASGVRHFAERTIIIVG